MSTLRMFGFALAPLYAAIAHVESDMGKTSDNIYQLRRIYVDDCNRILGKDPAYRNVRVRGFTYDDVNDKTKSERMMRIYWVYWGRKYAEDTGNPITYEVLARMHHGGPEGCDKAYTAAYWRRVQKALDRHSHTTVNEWMTRGKGK